MDVELGDVFLSITINTVVEKETEQDFMNIDRKIPNVLSHLVKVDRLYWALNEFFVFWNAINFVKHLMALAKLTAIHLLNAVLFCVPAELVILSFNIMYVGKN